MVDGRNVREKQLSGKSERGLISWMSHIDLGHGRDGTGRR